MSNENKDFMISPLSQVVPTGPINKTAPSYLIKIIGDTSTKVKNYKLFIAVEQPEMNSNFIHTKGFYSDAGEDDIVSSYKELLAATLTTQIIELWLPWHKIDFVRSLVFKTSNKK